MTGRDRFARWAGRADNRRGNPMKSKRTMQDGMTGRGLLDAEMVVGQETETGRDMNGREISETNPTHAEVEQLKGERDQLVDRLARLQAEFDNARKREAKERADSRDYATQAAVGPFPGVMGHFG